MLESVYLTKSKVRSRILGILFSNSQQKYYLSELARMTHTSAGNAQRELERFVRDGLVEREKRGSLVFYVLNQRHALFSELRSLVLKTSGLEGRLRDLLGKRKDIHFALFYGSFARKEENGESDIDLMIVSDGKLERFYSSLAKLEREFSREINPTVYSVGEFKNKISTGNSFIKNILNHPYRILKGDLHEFQRTVA